MPPSSPLRRLGHRVVWGLGMQDLVFRLREHRLAFGAPEPPCPDGLPTPPALLRVRVSGTAHPGGYFDAGKRILDEFDRFFAAHGGGFAAAGRVADIGCGVGRMARSLPASVETVGVDIDPVAIKWCQRNLPGDWRLAKLGQDAPVESASVDLLYACSVITHLRESTARAWLADLVRMLKPGGRAIVTFHDAVHPNAAPVSEQLATEGYAVCFDSLEGSNHLSAFVTTERLTQLAEGLERVAVVASDATLSGQAMALFRKPA